MPETAGSHLLDVRTFNVDGNVIDSHCSFRVSAKDPVGSWTLEEPAGSAEVADAGGVNLGRLGSGVVLGADGPGSATTASGGLQIGRSLSDGSYGSHFTGVIDDVRAYSGALDTRTLQVLSMTTGIEIPQA
jgi:hypothetical protein